MNIEERLTKYLDALESAVAAGAEQAPDVAREFLAWQFLSSVLAAATSLVVLAMVTYLMIRFVWPACKRDDPDSAAIVIVGYPIGIVLMGLCVVFCLFDITRAIKVSVAPRVVLLEKVAELAKEVRR